MSSDLIITNAGLAAASVATPTGPYINIVQFKLGNNATTPPSVNDTALAGAVVYTGVPSSFSYYDSETLMVNCEVPADVGPFNYGEVGVYLPGDVLFARFSFGVLRTKNTSLSSGFANVLRIKCLLRLVQGPAVFGVTPGTDQEVLTLANTSLVNTPFDYPDNPIVLVHEPIDWDESLMLFKHDNTQWNPINYTRIGTAAVTAAPDTTHITATRFGLLTMPASTKGKFLVQTVGGYVRMLKSLSGNTAELTYPIDTASLVGQKVALYQLNTSALGDSLNALNDLSNRLSTVSVTAPYLSGNGTAASPITLNWAAIIPYVFANVSCPDFNALLSRCPVQGLLGLAINPAVVSLVWDEDEAYNVAVATYAPTGNATITLLSGSLPPGVSLVEVSDTTLRAQGTPTTAGSYSASFNITTATHEGQFTLIIQVQAVGVYIADKAITSYVPIADDSYVSYILGSDGSAKFTSTSGGAGNFTGEWKLEGASNAYEARCTLVTGTITSGNLNIWQNLGTTRTWTTGVPWQDALPGEINLKEATLLIEIRSAATMAILDSATINLSAMTYFFLPEDDNPF